MTEIAHLIVDVETGGFSLERNPLLEIGWAFCDAEWDVIEADSVGVLPTPGLVIEPRAAEINHYSEAMWAEYGRPLEQARETFLSAMESFRGDVCYGHNVSMEERWLGAHVPPFHGRIREWRCSLKALRAYCKWHGLSTDDGATKLENSHKLTGQPPQQAHSAMDDCISTAAVLKMVSKSRSSLVWQ